MLQNLVDHADVIAVGGAMAYTFIAAQGGSVGTSLVETDRVSDAQALLARARTEGCRILLPTDHVISQSLDPSATTRIVAQVPPGWMGVDIGPETADCYAQEISQASTLFWNGPMGVFEVDAFAAGTERVARAVAQSGAVTVVGGGDSLAAVNKLKLGKHIDHLSTGGGASLEFVQGLELPGVAALEH